MGRSSLIFFFIPVSVLIYEMILEHGVENLGLTPCPSLDEASCSCLIDYRLTPSCRVYLLSRAVYSAARNAIKNLTIYETLEIKAAEGRKRRENGTRVYNKRNLKGKREKA